MTSASSPLSGAVDLHIHTAPDIFARNVTAVTAAEQAQAAGMAAIMVKSHSTDTSARAELARETTGFPVYGGVVLNYPVGGINRHAVVESARQGGRLVWMPTLGARHFFANAAAAPMLAAMIPPGVDGLTPVENGRLTYEAEGVLDAIAEHGMTLATGHIHPDDSLVLVRAAADKGISRIIVTHPLLAFVGATIDQMRELASMGAYLEFIDGDAMDERAAAIRAAGIEHCFMSTDAGTTAAPTPVLRLTSYAAGMAEAGFSAAELTYLMATVPSYLLGLTDERPELPTA